VEAEDVIGNVMVERYRRIGEALSRSLLRRMVSIAVIALVVGRAVRFTIEPLASIWRRIITPIIGSLTPEELL
jgi:hypothetical protein